MFFYARHIAAQLRKPSGGIWQFVARKMLLDTNKPLAQKTFDALQSQPDEEILEMGFGFGLGISYALEKSIRNGSGTLYGVDYSESACDYVTKLLPKDIESGKLKIIQADVAKMPLEDSTMDKAFHNYCYHFWPDMDAAAKEISRVMKPGGLIVAGMNLRKLDFIATKGFLDSWMYNPDRYTTAMEKAGFSNFKQEFVREDADTEFLIIHATNEK